MLEGCDESVPVQLDSANPVQELRAEGLATCNNSIDQVFANAQVLARGLQIGLTRDDGVQVPGVANPIQFSGTAIEYLAPRGLFHLSDPATSWEVDTGRVYGFTIGFVDAVGASTTASSLS